MKLESLKLEKFKGCTLKREQMFKLSGGGVKSDPGETCGPHGQEGRVMHFSYGYDSLRNGELTYHNRSNVEDICEQPS
ncbi:hypothetical protein [Flavobacterium sp. FlaQc-30]|uniref:hypothetical protein n=1 Tax=Flavobacterium sp. FlaQc-30 TaxID=3374179 RepID=UPI003756F1C0